MYLYVIEIALVACLLPQVACADDAVQALPLKNETKCGGLFGYNKQYRRCVPCDDPLCLACPENYLVCEKFWLQYVSGRLLSRHADDDDPWVATSLRFHDVQCPYNFPPPDVNGRCSNCSIPHCSKCTKRDDECEECSYLDHELYVDANGHCSPCTCGYLADSCNSDGTCNKCKDGKYLKEGRCVPCSSDGCVCYGPDSCWTCDDGYYKVNITVPVNCTGSCKSVNQTSAICLPCPEGCDQCNDSTQCDTEHCYQGYSFKNGTCISCNMDDMHCSTCEFAPRLRCTECKYPYYWGTPENDQVNVTCLRCDKNCIGGRCRSDTGECESGCKDGYGQYDRYGKGDGCIKFSDHCSSYHGDINNCTSCEPGFGLTKDGRCLPCEPPCGDCKYYKHCLKFIAPGPPSDIYTFLDSWRNCNGTHLAYSPKWCSSTQPASPYILHDVYADEGRWNVTLIKKSDAGVDAILSTAARCNKKKAYLQVVEQGQDCNKATLQLVSEDKVQDPTVWRLNCRQFTPENPYKPYACSIKALNRPLCQNSYITSSPLCAQDKLHLSSIKGSQWQLLKGKCNCDKLKTSLKGEKMMTIMNDIRDGGNADYCEDNPCPVDDCDCQCFGTCHF